MDEVDVDLEDKRKKGAKRISRPRGRYLAVRRDLMNDHRFMFRGLKRSADGTAKCDFCGRLCTYYMVLERDDGKMFTASKGCLDNPHLIIVKDAKGVDCLKTECVKDVPGKRLAAELRTIVGRIIKTRPGKMKNITISEEAGSGITNEEIEDLMKGL